MGASEIGQWVSLLVRLGLAVYEAARTGDNTRTVGQIFADTGTDLAKIHALADEARAHYAQDRGRAAFEAYHAGKGNPPVWATLPGPVRQRWIAAALA